MEKLFDIIKSNRLIIILILTCVSLFGLYVDKSIDLSKTETELARVIKEKSDLNDRLELERNVSMATQTKLNIIDGKFEAYRERIKEKLLDKTIKPSDLAADPIFKPNTGNKEKGDDDAEPGPSNNLSDDALFARDLLCDAGLAEDNLCNNP